MKPRTIKEALTPDPAFTHPVLEREHPRDVAARCVQVSRAFGSAFIVLNQNGGVHEAMMRCDEADLDDLLPRVRRAVAAIIEADREGRA